MRLTCDTAVVSGSLELLRADRIDWSDTITLTVDRQPTRVSDFNWEESEKRETYAPVPSVSAPGATRLVLRH